LADAQAELANLKAANADLADQFLRAKAEVENARRRAEEEVSKARKFAVEAFAESLLPVADSLSAGLAIADATAEQLREGSEATLRQGPLAPPGPTRNGKHTPPRGTTRWRKATPTTSRSELKIAGAASGA